MPETIQLTEKERKIMRLDSSEATIADIEEFKKSSDYLARLEQLRQTEAGGVLLQVLQDKAESKASVDEATQARLRALEEENARLKKAQQNPQTQNPQPATGNEISTNDLPVAPVTTFNIFRLIQMGYIPVEKPGKLMSPKWVFYGPNAVNLWSREKTEKFMLDWAGGKQNNAYRVMLDNEISSLQKDIKSYQDSTKSTFGVKAELEKQLSLLESIRTERDPKRVIELGNEYVASRSRTHFSGSAVAYDDPAVRKTTAQLDAETIHIESRTQATEKHIKNMEQDIKAMTTNGEKDASGKTRKTLDDINKEYDEMIRKKGAEFTRKIGVAEKAIAQPKKDYVAAMDAYKKVEKRILELQSKLDTAPISKPTKPNKDGTFPMTQAEINAELNKLGRIDMRGKPRLSGTVQELFLAGNEVVRTKAILDPLEKTFESLKKREGVYEKSLNTKRNQEIKHFNERKANLEAQLQQSRIAQPKRQEKELRVTEVNEKIKGIEAKLAANPTTSERLKLEADLRELYAQKNAAATAFNTALKSNNGRNDSQTRLAVEQQQKEVQKELDKLRQLSVEMDVIKTQIDAIQNEVESAKNALNNERDPVKAKKLRDEMPGKVNAANQKILELNLAGEKLVTGTGINWNKIPDLELKSILKSNLLLSKFLAAPRGVITRMETFGETPAGQKTMKLVYGGLRWVAVASAARTIGNDIADKDLGIKAAGLDALDAGMGFVGMVPVVGNIASGVWDIGWAVKEFATGTDINGRKVSNSQSFVRFGFGVVGLIPVAGNIAKGFAATRGALKVVKATEAIESGANVAMKGAVLTQVGTLAYDVVDVTANMTRNPAETAFKVLRGQEQDGIVFTKK